MHRGKISPEYLSRERKNMTRSTSILALKNKWVSCWEVCGIPGPEEGQPGAWLDGSGGKTNVIPSHSSTLGILLQILETQHLSF